MLPTATPTPSSTTTTVVLTTTPVAGVVDTAAPSAPGTLAVSGSTSDGVSFSWLASVDDAGVVGYEIWRNGLRLQLAPASQTTFNDSALAPNTSYTYSVRALDASGNASTFSVDLSVRTLPASTPADTSAPSTPAGLAAGQVTDSSLTFSWSPSTDNQGVVRYEVYRGSTLVASTAQTSFVLTGLTASTPYSLTIKAFDATGNASGTSATLVLTTAAAPATPTPDTTAPTVPTALAVTQTTTNSLNLNWTAGTDNIGVVGYNILRNGTIVGSSNTPGYLLTGLAASTTYSLAVNAFDAVGNTSATSTALSATTASAAPATDTTAPTSPTGLSLNIATSNSLTIGWAASTDAVGVTGYNIYKAGALVGTVTARSYTVTGLAASTSYALTVRAVDAAGNLSTPAALTASTTAAADTTAPTKPAGLVVTNPTSSTLPLSWAASTDAVGVTGYKIFRGGSQVGSTTTATNFTLTGLTASVTYALTVSAVDAAGNVSALSNALNASTTAAPDTTPPTAPTSLAVTNPTASSLTLGWSASTDAVGVVRYDIYRDGLLAGNTTSTSFTLSGLVASTSYTLTVRAVDAAGNVSAASAGLAGSTSAVASGWAATNDGYYGTPTTSFTIPSSAIGADTGLYLIDVQASFPAVDWANIDRLYIPAGNYKFIRLGNLPNRSSSKKLVITNKDGQVKVGGLGHYYMIAITGGSNWVLTGRYDPVSQTGNASYPGHRGGAFANSQGKYGIFVDDALSASGISGIQISGKATQFELDSLEITRVDFAGVLVKTDNDPTAHMDDCKFHDLYIHDTTSEGIYIGNSKVTLPDSLNQHMIRNWQVYNNRILRTGTEAMQMSHLAGNNNHVHHNVFGPAAIDWRSAFQIYQDGNLVFNLREGKVLVEKNVVIGSAGTHFSLFSKPVTGDPTVNNVGLIVRDNYFSDMRNLALYAGVDAISGMSFVFQNNVWRKQRFEFTQVYPTATQWDHLLRNFNTTTPISFTNNDWDHSTLKFIAGNNSNALPTGNGTAGNVTGSGADRRTIDAVRFVNAGLPDGFDYLTLEKWTAASTLNANTPVTYPLNYTVMYNGTPYRCKLSPCPAGVVPPGNSGTWEVLTPFADDVRIVPGSTYDGYGLQPGL